MDTNRTIISLLRRYGVRKAAIFGSYARGDNDKSSDIDILIEPPKGMGLEFVRLKRELEQSLQREVDLLSYHGISPYMKNSILKYQKRLI